MRLGIIVGVLLLAAGCARFGAPGAPASPSPPDLAGTWVLLSGHGPAGQVHIPDAMRISITFQGSQAGGQACNHYGGKYVLTGSEISFSAMSMTEMACQQDIMAAEAAYHAALADVAQAERVGDQLTLRGEVSELVFDLLPPVPQAALQDTSWVLESIIQGDAVSSVQGDPRLLLNADGTFSGSTGCREFSGDYVISGDQVVATNLGATGECPPGFSVQDALVLEVLADGFTVEIQEDRLTLSDPGSHGLGYRAAS